MCRRSVRSQIPICDGFELARKMRLLEEINHWPPTTIIGISANDQAVVTAEAQGAGMDGFMAKPFKLATLLKIVDQIQYRQLHNSPSVFITHHLSVFRPDVDPVAVDSSDGLQQPLTALTVDNDSTATASATMPVGLMPPSSSMASTRGRPSSVKIHVDG